MNAVVNDVGQSNNFVLSALKIIPSTAEKYSFSLEIVMLLSKGQFVKEVECIEETHLGIYTLFKGVLPSLFSRSIVYGFLLQ